MSFAAVFPGQGSQSVGMLAAFLPEYLDIKHTFTEASEVLGYDIWHLIQSGPDELLNATERTQPALLAAGVALWRFWQSHSGPKPAFMAGHSLGEYTALVCADALDFKAAIKLVEFRGRTMQQAVPLGAGAMAAILGLEDEAVRLVCVEAAQDQVVQPANFNSPGQVVIAGEKPAVERAIAACNAKGAKRSVLLPVSVPSHCSLMKPAADQLAAKLAGLSLQSPQIPVIHNVDVAPHPGAAAIRQVLTAQLYSPVRWAETVQFIAGQGVSKLVEFGPGRVLCGLTKRINKSVEAYPVYDPQTVQAALAALGTP
ncbi:MAG: ACP S-malonyltransferase [Gammaproteobacteria bacterium]|nr:ACP S-malonyltransferase [Gammaproteobacteria bacterium]